MIFIGFGFLMVFLKTHSWTSVGFNFLIAALTLQWSILVVGFWHMALVEGEFHKINLNIPALIIGDFGAGAVLITFGALLGKVSLFQMWIIALLEIIFYAMFPLMAPFFMLPQMGPGLMKQYFSGFIMLQSWGPLFVILNKIMMEGAISETQAAAGRASADNTITLGNLDKVAAANGDLASIAGFMTMLIPVIASALAFGVHRLASQSESLLSSVNSGAAEAARMLASGSIEAALLALRGRAVTLQRIEGEVVATWN